MDMGMLPWVALVVAVSLSIRFGIEWILRRLGVERVEPEQPNGLQHLIGQVEQWAHKRRAQVAEHSERPTDPSASNASTGTSPRAMRRAARANVNPRERTSTSDGPDSTS